MHIENHQTAPICTIPASPSLKPPFSKVSGLLATTTEQLNLTAKQTKQSRSAYAVMYPAGVDYPAYRTDESETQGGRRE